MLRTRRKRIHVHVLQEKLARLGGTMQDEAEAEEPSQAGGRPSLHQSHRRSQAADAQQRRSIDAEGMTRLHSGSIPRHSFSSP